MTRPQYVAETSLRAITLKVIRMHVASVTGTRLVAAPGPYRVSNWQVDWLNVLAQDYGAARDIADELEEKGHWILVPDRHTFDPADIRVGGGALGSPMRLSGRSRIGLRSGVRCV